jgi:dienelactone hydrolase
MTLSTHWRSLPVLCALAAGLGAAPLPAQSDSPWEGVRLYVDTETPEYWPFVMDGPPEAAYIRRIIDRFGPRERRGVILHVPGCPYPTSRMAIHSQARFMASLGYVVLVSGPLPQEPSPQDCRTIPLELETQLQAARLRRLDELIELALSLPWVDRQRIFVSGFGEGGDAVLGYRHPAIRGRIAIAPRCRSGIEREPIPTLLITTRTDRWYQAIGDAQAPSRCAQTAAYRYAELFEVDGSLHDALTYDEARVALSHFLVRAGYRPPP